MTINDYEYLALRYLLNQNMLKYDDLVPKSNITTICKRRGAHRTSHNLKPSWLQTSDGQGARLAICWTHLGAWRYADFDAS